MKFRSLFGVVLVSLVLALSAHADSPDCLISFDSARLDVCSGDWQLINDDLRHLANVSAFNDTAYRVVKFDRPIGQSDRDALAALGVEILGYVPHYAYKVRMRPSMDAAVSELDDVAWVGPFLPVWKVGINLANDLQLGNVRRDAPDVDLLTVTLHQGAGTGRVENDLSAIPGLDLVSTGSSVVDEYLVMGFEADRLETIVEDLAVNEHVAAIKFRFPNKLLNSEGVWLHQSGEHDPPQTPLFDQGLFGCGQTIGILDSGMDVNHCSFEDTDPTNDFPYTHCTDGVDCPVIGETDVHRKVGAFYHWETSGGTPGDSHGHGTSVAGNALGSNWNNPVDCDALSTPGAMEDVDGMAPGARAIVQATGGGLDYLNQHGGNIYHAATTAFANGAYIHNNSWGSGCRGGFGACVADCIVEYRENSRYGDMAAWENPELLIFAAAGNSGGGDGNSGCGLGADVGAPGNAKSVFAIGGNQRGEQGDNTYMSSSRGPASDRRTKPDIIAQSQAVMTSSVGSGCGVGSATGTSFGSPTAAGFGALVREYLQRGFYPLGFEVEANEIPDPSAAVIRAIMTNSSVQIFGQGAGSDFPNQNIGWGRLLADNALYFDGDDRLLWIHDDKDGLNTGESDVHQVTVGDGGELIVTLIWHDYFAELNADPHIVNQLRLEVETPSGDVWSQKLTPGGGLADPNPFQDTTETDYDDRNTVHQIVLDAPENGTYEIRVTGIQVAMGDSQPYALAVTGDLLGIGDPDFILTRTPSQVSVCEGDDAVFDIGVLSISEFEDPVTLSVSDGLPAGASADFSINPVTPTDPATVSALTISGTGAVDAGSYTLEFSGESNGPEFDPITKTITAGLTVDEALGGPTLIAPPDGITDITLTPEFEWAAVSGAVEYTLQVATDSGFTNLVIDEVVEGETFTPDFELDTGTVHFWRVQGHNACGDGDWSTVFDFQTRFEPVAEIGPESFSFELTLGQSDSDTLNISNIGTGNLVWSIETDSSDGANQPLFGGDFDIDNWELVNDPSGVAGSFDTEPGPPLEVYITGGDAGVGGDTDLQIEIPTDGTIIFDWGYQTSDTACWDSGGYAINGVYTELACNDSPVPYFDETEIVEVSAGDIFAFRVHTQDGNFGAGVLGVTNFQFEPDVCDTPVGVPWLSVAPASGSTPAGDTDEVTVSVDSSGLNQDVFEGYLCIATNAQDAPMIPVPVELTVFDPDAGAVAGNVTSLGYCSDNPAAAGGAAISIEGSSGAVFTTTADGAGNFSININENESPVDITVSAAGHLDAVETGVSVTAGQTTTIDFDLLLDAPCATVMPAAFTETVTAGEVEDFDLTIGNADGAGSLDWDVELAESSCASATGVSWLSVAPDAGTAGGGASDIAVLTVDTDGLADGDYDALICVSTSDSEADAFEVPFTLTVIDPSLAVFEGTVSSVGLCGEDPGPLADATVTITGTENTFEVQTDDTGYYQVQVSEDESPADVSVTAEHHAGETETGVTFVGGDTVTLDFTLEAEAACASVTPESISETADLGDTVQTSIEIENTGNLALNWAIGYVNGATAAALYDAAAAEAAAMAGAGREVIATSPEDEALGIEVDPYQAYTVGESTLTAAQRRQIIEGGVILMPDSSSDRRMNAFDPETGDVIDLNFFDITDGGIPVHVILHPDGERFLLTRQSGAEGGIVEAYDMDGEFIEVFAPQGGQDQSIMQNIRGLAVHPATGNILVAVSGTNNTDPENRDAVLEFDQDGAFLGRFIESGAGGLNGPWSMVFRANDVVVADSGSDILRRYDWDGEFIEIFTEDPNFPQQIHLNADGHILAAGFSTPSGAWEWDEDGDQVGLYGPETGLRGVYELPGGSILVTNNGGVHEIDRDGNLVRTITADVTGRFLSLIQPALSCDPMPPEWLSVDPDAGSTDPGMTDTLDVTLDTAGLSPGEYTAQICVESNDPVNPVIPVDVTFTVELGPNFSVVQGEVFSLGFCGEDGFPAAGATVELVGQTETFTTTADGDGFYQIQVPADESPFDITASAPDHFDQTETGVTAPGGDAVTVDFNLEAEVPCVDVDPTELSATLEVGQSEDQTFEVFNTGTGTLNWFIDDGGRDVRDESAPLIGFNFTTSGSGTADPQNWTRISDAQGSLSNVSDDTGEATDVGISWGGVTTDGFVFLGTDNLAGDAVPQHHYDLSGMTGYGFRSGGDFFIEVDGLQPNAAYEYWFVAYRSTSAIDNDVQVSDGDELDAFEFNQFVIAGDNDGRFIVNELLSSDEQVWSELSFITHASSDGTITIHWQGDSQTTVIGAFAIRSALSCDIPEWLAVAPTSGSIEAGAGSDTVTATLDATGLEPGEYTASICVESDDPVNPVVPVDVNLVVEFGDDFGFLSGQVNSLGYCSDNPFAAEGATLEIIGQTETYTATADENGEYSIAIPVDESPVDITASAAGHLPVTVENVDLIGGDVVNVDFDLTLDAPCATVAPDSLAFTVGFGGSDSDQLEIGNVEGAGELDWNVFTAEVEGVDPRAHFPEVPYAFEPGDPAEVSVFADAGAAHGVITEGAWPLGADVPVYTTTGWDSPGYITMDALVPGEYTIIEPDQPTSVFAATFIANDFSTHYGLATDGGDLAQDTFIAIDTETGEYQVLGTVSGSPGDTWTSMSWDHTTSTLYASTVGELYTIDVGSLEATLVGPIEPAGTVISMAISPEGLMYGIDLTNDTLLAIDKTTGDASAIGPLGFAPNFAQDMDFDQSDGTLYWGGYFGGGDSQVLVIDTDTGAATSLGNVQGGTELLSFSIAIPGMAECAGADDIDWLSVDPQSGTTAAGATDTVSVQVDADGLPVGTHEANVCVASNDPEQSLNVVPVTLTVTEVVAATLEGNVMSLGYCQDDPGAAVGALVVVQGQESSYTTTTDGGGFYQLSLPAEESPVSVTVSLVDHRTASADNVELVAGEVTEVDFDLVLHQACAQITPESFAFSVTADGQDGDVLVVSNALGGADLGWWLETGEGCHDPADNGWLSLSQNSATVAWGNTREFGVLINAEGLEPGEYATTLCIGTDDADADSFAIPVNLEVSTDEPVIFHDRFEANDNG